MENFKLDFVVTSSMQVTLSTPVTLMIANLLNLLFLKSVSLIERSAAFISPINIRGRRMCMSLRPTGGSVSLLTDATGIIALASKP